MKMNIYDHKLKYERWWLNKFCRRALGCGNFKKVVKIELNGSHSFVYGSVTLYYEDETYDNIMPLYAFRPRRCDVEIAPQNIVETGDTAHNISMVGAKPPQIAEAATSPC